MIICKSTILLHAKRWWKWKTRRLPYPCCACTSSLLVLFPPLYRSRVDFLSVFTPFTFFVLFTGPSLLETNFCRNFFPSPIMKGQISSNILHGERFPPTYTLYGYYTCSCLNCTIQGCLQPLLNADSVPCYVYPSAVHLIGLAPCSHESTHKFTLTEL